MSRHITLLYNKTSNPNPLKGNNLAIPGFHPDAQYIACDLCLLMFESSNDYHMKSHPIRNTLEGISSLNAEINYFPGEASAAVMQEKKEKFALRLSGKEFLEEKEARKIKEEELFLDQAKAKNKNKVKAPAKKGVKSPMPATSSRKEKVAKVAIAVVEAAPTTTTSKRAKTGAAAKKGKQAVAKKETSSGSKRKSLRGVAYIESDSDSGDSMDQDTEEGDNNYNPGKEGVRKMEAAADVDQSADTAIMISISPQEADILDGLDQLDRRPNLFEDVSQSDARRLMESNTSLSSLLEDLEEGVEDLHFSSHFSDVYGCTSEDLAIYTSVGGSADNDRRLYTFEEDDAVSKPKKKGRLSKAAQAAIDRGRQQQLAARNALDGVLGLMRTRLGSPLSCGLLGGLLCGLQEEKEDADLGKIKVTSESLLEILSSGSTCIDSTSAKGSHDGFHILHCYYEALRALSQVSSIPSSSSSGFEANGSNANASNNSNKIKTPAQIQRGAMELIVLHSRSNKQQSDVNRCVKELTSGDGLNSEAQVAGLALRATMRPWQLPGAREVDLLLLRAVRLKSKRMVNAAMHTLLEVRQQACQPLPLPPPPSAAAAAAAAAVGESERHRQRLKGDKYSERGDGICLDSYPLLDFGWAWMPSFLVYSSLMGRICTLLEGQRREAALLLAEGHSQYQDQNQDPSNTSTKKEKECSGYDSCAAAVAALTGPAAASDFLSIFLSRTRGSESHENGATGAPLPYNTAATSTTTTTTDTGTSCTTKDARTYQTSVLLRVLEKEGVSVECARHMLLFLCVRLWRVQQSLSFSPVPVPAPAPVPPAHESTTVASTVNPTNVNGLKKNESSLSMSTVASHASNASASSGTGANMPTSNKGGSSSSSSSSSKEHSKACASFSQLVELVDKCLNGCLTVLAAADDVLASRGLVPLLSHCDLDSDTFLQTRDGALCVGREEPAISTISSGGTSTRTSTNTSASQGGGALFG